MGTSTLVLKAHGSWKMVHSWLAPLMMQLKPGPCGVVSTRLLNEFSISIRVATWDWKKLLIR